MPSKYLNNDKLLECLTAIYIYYANKKKAKMREYTKHLITFSHKLNCSAIIHSLRTNFMWKTGELISRYAQSK